MLWRKVISSEQLLKDLESSDEKVLEKSVIALGKLKELRALDPLIKLLVSRCSKVIRYRVAQALVKLGDPRAVEPLISLLQDEDKDVRQIAVEALDQLGDKTRVWSLIAMLN